MNDASDPTANPPASMPASPLSEAPLTWWRTLPPETLDVFAQQRLRASLLAVPALAEGVARPGSLDLALSAVLLCATLGDPACRALLVHALGRRARRRADLDVLRLAHAWRHRGHQGSSSITAPGR
jgi:hypothetical protein